MSLETNILKRTPSADIQSTELKQAVDDYIRNNPEKAALAQKFGEYLMSTPFANTDTFKVCQEDIEGEELLYNALLKKISFYGLEITDLLEEDIRLLRNRLGENWQKYFDNLY